MPGSTNYPASLDSHTGGNPFGFAEAINRKATTLNGALNNSATTITVVSTTGFPTRGLLAVGNEVVTYTGTTATTFTGVTRGAGGTSAVSHPSGEWVANVPTAANHNDLAAAIVALQTKLGTGASVAAADTVMRGTGANATDFGKVLNAHVDAAAAIALSKLAAGSTGFLKSNGTAITAGNFIDSSDIVANAITNALMADNAINTAEIVDGAVTTDKIAANAVSVVAATNQSGNVNTTSATGVSFSGTALTATITTAGGNILVWGFASVMNSVAGNRVWLYTKLDSGSFVDRMRAHVAVANYYIPLSFCTVIAGGSAGSHTVELGWSTDANTATAEYRGLLIMELKK